ncbi:MAG: UDP-4-amino-4,6-dideoxy-N-acetyl-beta-L-altrosamine N-acetyltransferase [Candidatus Zixiibacteriota bacterium]|nr:MAG: UDP-4-amino-4,6-dideoxy-N-acetyl-beta-L-altrosamine N-acetyltransferase [candidate division Zixibacteria bacterium]
MLRREDYQLRPMREDDLEIVLQWRNSERIRSASYTDHIISMEEHRAWFRRVSEDERYLQFVFEYLGRPVGVVNISDINKADNRCVWGFYIGAEDIPRGCGSAMGFFALEHLFENLGFRKVVGEALTSNEGSVRYHERLGFIREGILVEHVLKNGKYEDVMTLGHFEKKWREIKSELAEKFFDNEGESCVK